MPRKRKYPFQVKIKIPFEKFDIWERDIFDLLFEEKEAETARKIISWIQKNERLYPEDYRHVVGTSPAEVKRYNRVMAKLVTLGLIGRGKEASYILNDEFAHKLNFLAEKWLAIYSKKKMI